MKRLSFAKLCALTLLAAMAFGATACGGSKKQEKAPDEQTTETGEQADTKTVVLYNYRFNPNQLTVAEGTTVTFENKDPDKHNVNIPALNVDENLESGQTFSHTFGTTGSFAVSNRFATTPMKMTIEVTADGGGES
ncbi:MAG: cupredoxin domain-containing protein [Myxococcota bacterium]